MIGCTRRACLFQSIWRERWYLSTVQSGEGGDERRRDGGSQCQSHALKRVCSAIEDLIGRRSRPTPSRAEPYRNGSVVRT